MLGYDIPFTVGIDIVVNWKDVIRQTSLRRFKAHKRKSCWTILVCLEGELTSAPRTQLTSRQESLLSESVMEV